MSHDSFPKFLYKVLSFLEENEFTLYIVGGSARSYYLNESIDRDIDFEVRSKTKTIQDWRDLREHFKKKFKFKYRSTHFDVLGFTHEGKSVEFAPSRTETYEEKQYYGHSDFKAEFNLNLTDKEAFARRDLTINAFAYKVTKGELGSVIDPFGGIEDLKAKKARPITKNFHKDPVRVIRSIRFMSTLGLKATGALEKEWQQADCRKLSSYYFWYEANKNQNLIPYMITLKEVSQKFKINLPFHLAEIFQSPIEDYNNLKIDNKNDFLCLLFKSNQQVNLGKYSKCFQVSYKELEGLRNFWRYWNSWNTENKLHQFSMSIKQFDKFHEVLDYLNPWVSFVAQFGKLNKWKSSLKAIFDEEEVYALELIERWQLKHKQFNVAPKMIQNISPKNRDKYKWFHSLKK